MNWVGATLTVAAFPPSVCIGMLETTRSAACIRSQKKRLDIVVHFALAREDSYLRLWSFSSFRTPRSTNHHATTPRVH
jgi:hypothetical protein